MVTVKRVQNQEGIKRLHNALKELGRAEGKVGYFESAKYPDGTPVATVAAIQELGSVQNNIPPRPTMRPAGIETKKEFQSHGTQGMKAILAGTETMVSVMSKVCDLCAGLIKKNISKITQPPLKKSTVLARQSMKNQDKTFVSTSLAKPLIHTGILLNSPTYKVERK